jgi:hypothetical protein
VPTRGPSNAHAPRLTTGHADGSILIGALAVAAVNLALWLLAHALVARGYRLKA